MLKYIAKSIYIIRVRERAYACVYDKIETFVVVRCQCTSTVQILTKTLGENTIVKIIQIDYSVDNNSHHYRKKSWAKIHKAAVKLPTISIYPSAQSNI